jgi:hypothetical protein
MNGMDIVLMLQKRNLLKVFHDEVHEDDVNAIIENIKILYTLKKKKKKKVKLWKERGVQ